MRRGHHWRTIDGRGDCSEMHFQVAADVEAFIRKVAESAGEHYEVSPMLANSIAIEMTVRLVAKMAATGRIRGLAWDTKRGLHFVFRIKAPSRVIQ